jgi:hypothetical protein
VKRIRSKAIAAVLTGLSLGALGLGAQPAQAAPADISPQRVSGAYAADGLHVFVRGTTGYLYEKIISPNGQQSGWTQSGATIASSPAATVDSEGRIYVAARLADGTVFYQWLEPNGGWASPANLGGSTYGAPALQAVPAQNGQYAEVIVAAQDASGRAQARAFTPGTLSPPIAHWTSWGELDGRVLTAAPMLSATQDCEDTPREGAPDSPWPNAVFLEGRTSDGTGAHRSICGDAPAPAPSPWASTVGKTSSGVAGDGYRQSWYRGADGALWADDTRVGVPAPGRRVACTPTVAGYRVPANGGPLTDPNSILVRDDQGTSWLYTPPAPNTTVGGSWTNLGGIAT